MFSRYEQLLMSYVLPKGQKDNQDYLQNNILARLKAEKTQMTHGKEANHHDAQQ
jgi:hypothetical protein